MHIYKIEYGATDWFIAENFTQLIETIEKTHGKDYMNECFDKGVHIYRLSPDRNIVITHNDCEPEMIGSKTVKEWMELSKETPCMLCSTLF